MGAGWGKRVGVAVGFFARDCNTTNRGFDYNLALFCDISEERQKKYFAEVAQMEVRQDALSQSPRYQAMRLPIKHKACGATVLWWVADRLPHVDDAARTAEIERLDGSRPEYGQIPIRQCPHCNLPIIDTSQLRRFTIGEDGEIIPLVRPVSQPTEIRLPWWKRIFT
jgi:hypothetical protein